MDAAANPSGGSVPENSPSDLAGPSIRLPSSAMEAGSGAPSITEGIQGTLIKLEKHDGGGHADVFVGRWIRSDGSEQLVSHLCSQVVRRWALTIIWHEGCPKVLTLCMVVYSVSARSWKRC